MRRAAIEFTILFLMLAAVSGCGDKAGGAAAEKPETKAPLFEGLGNFGRKVTTTSPEAQRYFDQGLCFLYAFNHDEAIRSLQQAATLDSSCPMAWWRIA